MKLPKLPVYPKGERDIIDEDGKFVCFANTTDYRDYIVKAINGHEKIIEFARKGEEITDSKEHPEGCYACRSCDEPGCNLLALFVKIRQEAEQE